MGQELNCFVTFNRQRSRGKALLETQEILFRGDYRLKIPLKDIRRLDAKNGELKVTFSGGTAVFELGEAAAKWLHRIRNPRSRVEKLGIKPDQCISVLGLNDAVFLGELKSATLNVSSGKAAPESDQIFFAAAKAPELKKLAQLKKSLAPAGALWVLRPKGSPDLTEAQVREAAKDSGLVDVKVVAFSDALTAEKLVIPVAKRKG
ncbi:MAG: DUF3052 family protein [Planctomycetes bacterium]|nr:DUF3052 family protein [Planctomycetota bacterium]